jgi:hypothetical protein
MPLLENVYKGGTPVDRVYRGTSLAWQRVVDPPPADPSWQEAWDTRDFTTIRNWYRANTGIEWAIKTNELSSWDDLTPSGTVNTTSNGQVIENLNISGTVWVHHDNVTVQNCYIGNNATVEAVGVPFSAMGNVHTLTLRNLTCQGVADGGQRPPPYPASGDPVTYRQTIAATYITPASGASGLQASRVYSNGFGQGFRLSPYSYTNPERVEYSAVENIRPHHGPNPPTTTSHNTAYSFNGGADKSVFRCWLEGTTSAALSLYPDVSAITGFECRETLFDAYYNYAIQAGGGKEFAGQSNWDFIDNLFTKNYISGVVTGSTTVNGSVWSGNFHLDGTAAGPNV